MAEIILPPEENEETPETPELDIDKPTENSKIITIEFEAKKTNKVSTKDTNQQLYTTDTDAWFEFKETSLEGANGTYSVVFRNRHDGSIFQRTGDVVNGVAYYKIPHQEIRHAGAWRGQIVYTLSNGDTTAREFDYDVKGHILDGKDVREIVVEDFETLMSQLRNMKDNAELELANLVNTANQNETDRQAFFDSLVADINDLQTNYDELLDTGVLQTNINTKLEALEEEYAPKLTEVTAQLAQTVSGLNQQDFFSFQQRNSPVTSDNTYSVLGDRFFNFKVGLGGNEFIEHTFKKNPLDDFIKWTESVFQIQTGDGSIVKRDFSDDMVSGGTVSGSSQNYYVTEVGATLTFPFEGVGISLWHRADDRGGVWECFVDDVKVKDISTHIDAIPPEYVNAYLAKQTIATNLSNDSHILKMVFKGDDPSHEPSSGAGTSRGWIRRYEGTAGNPEANQETFEIIVPAGTSSVPVIYNSNKEFAFSAKENGASHNPQWYPEHNSTGTVFVGLSGSQELYVDGILVNSSEVVENKPFNEAILVQALDFKHPMESTRLGELIQTATINSKGVSLTSKVVWEKEVFINAGYTNMFTLDKSFAQKLISSFGGKYPLSAIDNSNTTINENAPVAFIALNDEMPNYYAYMQVFNPVKSLRLKEPGRRGDDLGKGLYWLQHRDASLQKLYPHVYTQYTASSGEVYQFEGHYGFGKHPQINALID